jgi:hypothetical protein
LFAHDLFGKPVSTFADHFYDEGENSMSFEANAAAAGAQRQAPTIRNIDRPEVAETFADTITSLVFDGQSLRIEFGVTRLDEVKANTPISGRRYTACRLVLPPAAAVDLINRMQQIGTALTQAGVTRQAPRTSEPAAN